jgi:hypothetical protein
MNTVANYLPVELTILKAMAQELADLFSLTFPESFEKQTHIYQMISTGTFPEPRYSTFLREQQTP